MAIKVAEIPFREQKTTKQQHAATAYIIYYTQVHEGTLRKWSRETNQGGANKFTTQYRGC